MIEPGLIAAFRDVFKARPLDVRVDDCLNRRHKGAGCRRCADACPTQAITLSGGLPWLDDSQCVNCGACLRQCPTDAFVQARTPEADLLSTHIELSLEPLGLICPVHQSPEETSMPVSRLLQHKRCLAGFSVEQLLALAGEGERPLWLDDSFCGRCPIGHARHTFVETAAAARQLLAACSRPHAIHVLGEEDALAADVAHPVRILQSGQPELSRRGLFKMLAGRVQQQAVDLVEATPAPRPSGPVPVAERLPHRLPASRRRLNARLTLLAQTDSDFSAGDAIPAAVIPYGDVLIDDVRCTACALCARFCPTGALRFRTSEAPAAGKAPAFILDFRADFCVDCNICVAACPEEAVRMAGTVATGALVGARWEGRVEGKLVECAECGTPTRGDADGGEALCSLCRRGGGVFKPGARADLLADLGDHLR